MSVDTVKKRKRMKSRKLRSVVTLGERKEGNMIMEGYIGVFNWISNDFFLNLWSGTLTTHYVILYKFLDA